MADRKIQWVLPGLGLVLVLALVATALGRQFPLVGGAVFGILLGIALRWRFSLDARLNAGIGFASRDLLQWSIVALGFCLPIERVAATGVSSLAVTLVTISAAFLSALVVGKLLRVPLKLCVLIGTGTAICGGSAIAAMTPAVKADKHETAFSLSTIFLFNIIAVLIFPMLGHLFGLSDSGFGLWAGTAINDTSSVVAAAYAWSKEAGEYATIVKLTRAMLIIPVTLVVGILFSIYQNKEERLSLKTIRSAVPLFILWFVVASVVGPYMPDAVIHAAHLIAPFMIVAALTAIGLSTDLGKMRETGWRPMVLGLVVWFSVASTSLLVQKLSGSW
jgi:uncharacterized integral membrane protein (TIGR00698 family)